MAFIKPPMLTGNNTKDLANLRDYLFRIAGSLDSVTAAAESTDLSVSYTKDGRQIVSPGGGANQTDIQKIRAQANELRDLIIKTANGVQVEIVNRINGDAAIQGNLDSEALERAAKDLLLDGKIGTSLADAKRYADAIGNGVISYTDQKTEEYNAMYVAKSEYGQFVEGITSTIETTARGVVDSYNYASAIQSVQDDVDQVQAYYTAIASEIRRGIVQDPSTGNYVTGIAISQNLRFSGECGPSDTNNPGDGYTYYYLTSGQTFGLYTSTGWQFWIDGAKVGWFDSQDGMLHVGTVHVEERIVNGGYWEQKTENINSKYMFVINYIGG